MDLRIFLIYIIIYILKHKPVYEWHLDKDEVDLAKTLLPVCVIHTKRTSDKSQILLWAHMCLVETQR